ncbi:MAG: hypothetical protein COC19_05875 [SAR86 cluster bacterium]|uniref:PhnB-like domain-containing protein n=1 Tax=SAR86 cluster bacterium TaxID=2030880 RepID=A0A2A4MLL5_9GAMM|nr:MAG: hypothetical protein COC19_05875 [SAR86 cluster bacterium]
MKLNPHLTFNGNCKAAFEFYHDLLGGSLTLISYADSPAAAQVPPDWQHRIVHGTLTLAESEIAGADILPEQYTKPAGFCLLLQPENEDKAKRLFASLSENGNIEMPIQQVFWSACYAKFTDQFGTPWEISCVEAPSHV